MSKQQPTFTNLPEQRHGEDDVAYWRRLERWLSRDDIRSKDDLRDWTGSPTFHLNRPADETKR